jgi:hypothetical protein
MAKVSALFNLGAALEATIEIGRRAAAGDPVAVSGLPTMTLSPATRESLTTYLKNPEALDSRQRNVLEKYLIRSSQEGSSWGSRERMRQSGVTEYAGEAQERRIITPEQLYNERANLAPVMGDKSVTGREIVSVQGVPLSKAVMGDGGPGYAQAWEDFNVAWASMEGAAKAKQIHFDKIARDTNGKAPVGVYMAMTDVAMDFNTMTSEGLIRQFKSLDVSKSDKDAFDAAVRESIPEWAGIDSPDAIDQIYGNVPLTSANKKSDALPSSALRKRLVFEFGKKKWQDKGFPVYDDVIVAFTEPALLNAKLGDSGFTMFDTMPGADVVPVVGHNTYDTSIMGKYKGGFEQSVPTEIMFPKLWADLEGQMTVPKEGSRSAPRLLNRQEKIGAIRLGHGYQPADQAWLDGISSWLEKNKGTASSALLATLVSAGIITPQDAEAGVITGFAKGGQKAADMMLQNTADAADQVAVEGIRAYHGSPHDFPPVRELEMPDGAVVYQSMDDAVPEGARVIKEHPLGRFDMSKLGTGEGAQAYGRGLYFAEAEDVAKGYRDTLSNRDNTGYATAHLNAKNLVERMNNDPEWAAEVLRDYLKLTPSSDYNVNQMEKTLQFIESGDYKKELPKRGTMYEVDIDANPDEFLDYDKPLSEQSEKVRKAIKSALESKGFSESQIEKFVARDVDGQELNAALSAFDEAAGANRMLSQGIKGIKYLDQGSRAAGKGTSNYVVFDDRLITISKKYGISIPAAAAVLAGTMTPEEAQASTPQDQQASEYPSLLGGMGVRMPPTAEDEEAMLAPTGGDLMQQANRDFVSSIRTQPEPDFLTSVQQQLLSGIMKTAGVADLSADVVSAMAGPLLSAPGAIARYAADRYVPGVNYSAEEMAQGRRETEDYFNYQPRTEQGPQYGEQIMQGIGGAIAPYVPAIKKAAGDSYILGAMRQGYDYLGDKEKELAKALMDLSPI